MSHGVAYAVVHDGSPTVLLANDVEILQRVIATQIVAQTDPSRLTSEQVTGLQESLINEQWGDAVFDWIENTGIAIDVYTTTIVWSAEMLPDEVTSFELRTTPLFRA